MARQYNRKLTQAQYDILSVIASLYKQYGQFPTYEQVGRQAGVSKQRIEQTVKAINKKSIAYSDTV